MSTQNDSNERYAAYKDPDIAQFLIKLNNIGGEVTPKYDETHGYRYPRAEELTGKNPKQVNTFLKKLSDLGLLNAKILDMALFCPDCNSANVSTRYICPHCGSFKIERNAIIEHLTCGYIDNLKNFVTEDELICPKCKKTLKRNETRSAGRWYECLDCKKKIENLQTLHKCRLCGAQFDFNESKYLAVASYLLSDEANKEISHGVLFSHLMQKFFTDQNYEAQVPGKIVGASGVQQEFDVLVKTKNNTYVAIDSLLSGLPVSEQQLQREYGKIFDAKIETYIIAQSIAEEARHLIKKYRLNVVETNKDPTINAVVQIASDIGIKIPKRPAEKTLKSVADSGKKKGLLSFRKKPVKQEP